MRFNYQPERCRVNYVHFGCGIYRFEWEILTESSCMDLLIDPDLCSVSASIFIYKLNTWKQLNRMKLSASLSKGSICESRFVKKKNQCTFNKV